jgi:methyl-accepting chemotaxis protein
MPYLILTIAVVSLLLIGCSSIEERQERAADLFQRAAEGVIEGVETAKDVKDQVVGTLSGAVSTIQATTSELQRRADQIQEGAEKVTNAIGQIQEGVDEVKGAVNVAGESEDAAE